MNDIIQLAALATFAAAFAYMAMMAFREWRLTGHIAIRESTERERMRAEIDEILERTRIRQDKAEGAWSGFRKFRVAKKVLEADSVCSFYLEPHDGRPLPPFEPGQFLNFRLNIPDQPKPALPCYSLSDCARPDFYRVTIKRLGPPPSAPDVAPGVSSSHFHDQIEEGSIIDVKAPKGQFYLNTTHHTPVVLVGGGIGITPVLSMLNHIVESGSTRETWVFIGVRHGAEHVMKDHLKEIAAKYPNVKLVVMYSDPRDEDKLGDDYTEKGWVSVDLFKSMLPSNNYDYYFCGPPPMMNALFEGLREWDVPEDNIHYEAFGPATVGKKKEAQQKVGDGPIEGADPINVTFSRSGKTLKWNPSADSLLQFALDNGVAIDHSCEAGNCGTCVVALKSGELNYFSDPAEAPEPGTCYTCVTTPKGPIDIDA